MELLRARAAQGGSLPELDDVNELLRLCAAAEDVESAISVVAVLEASGQQPDMATFEQLAEVFSYFPKNNPNGAKSSGTGNSAGSAAVGSAGGCPIE